MTTHSTTCWQSGGRTQHNIYINYTVFYNVLRAGCALVMFTLLFKMCHHEITGIGITLTGNDEIIDIITTSRISSKDQRYHQGITDIKDRSFPITYNMTTDNYVDIDKAKLHSFINVF